MDLPLFLWFQTMASLQRRSSLAALLSISRKRSLNARGKALPGILHTGAVRQHALPMSLSTRTAAELFQARAAAEKGRGSKNSQHSNRKLLHRRKYHGLLLKLLTPSLLNL